MEQNQSQGANGALPNSGQINPQNNQNLINNQSNAQVPQQTQQLGQVPNQSLNNQQAQPVQNNPTQAMPNQARVPQVQANPQNSQNLNTQTGSVQPNPIQSMPAPVPQQIQQPQVQQNPNTAGIQQVNSNQNITGVNQQINQQTVNNQANTNQNVTTPIQNQGLQVNGVNSAVQNNNLGNQHASQNIAPQKLQNQISTPKVPELPEDVGPKPNISYVGQPSPAQNVNAQIQQNQLVAQHSLSQPANEVEQENAKKTKKSILAGGLFGKKGKKKKEKKKDSTKNANVVQNEVPNKVENQKNSESKKTNKKTKSVLLVVFILFILVAVLVFLFFALGDSNSNSSNDTQNNMNGIEQGSVEQLPPGNNVLEVATFDNTYQQIGVSGDGLIIGIDKDSEEQINLNVSENEWTNLQMSPDLSKLAVLSLNEFDERELQIFFFDTEQWLTAVSFNDEAGINDYFWHNNEMLYLHQGSGVESFLYSYNTTSEEIIKIERIQGDLINVNDSKDLMIYKDVNRFSVNNLSGDVIWEFTSLLDENGETVDQIDLLKFSTNNEKLVLTSGETLYKINLDTDLVVEVPLDYDFEPVCAISTDVFLGYSYSFEFGSFVVQTVDTLNNEGEIIAQKTVDLESVDIDNLVCDADELLVKTVELDGSSSWERVNENGFSEKTGLANFREIIDLE